MSELEEFVLVHLKPDFLIKTGLPDVAYPIPIVEIKRSTVSGENIDFAELLFYLQRYSAGVEKCWDSLEPAMICLAGLLAQENDDPVGNIHTPDFYLNIQQRDICLENIAVMRGNQVLAIIRPTNDYTLSVTAFHPFDSRTILTLMDLGRHPCRGQVCHRENNWEYALDMAAPTLGSMYACERGDSYLVYWKNGLGVNQDGEVDTSLSKYHTMKQIMPNIVAAQIGNFYMQT